MAGLDERWRSGLTALVAVGIPVAAGIAAGLRGDGDGPVSQAGAVLGAGLATLLATRRGLWWLVPAQPMAVVPSAVVGVLLAEPHGTNHTKLDTDSVSALHHAFVMTLVALGVVAIVALAKAVFGRGGDRAQGPAAPEITTGGARRVGAHRG